MFIKVEDIDLHAAIPRQVHLALTGYVDFRRSMGLYRVVKEVTMWEHRAAIEI